ncbi:RNA binding motif protein 12Ba [Austrofundulus limnaeus]|uniref:RNA-binding protein 12B-like n=1 Tax=Austrofundulus limnaeus TaxID=52670 RepID=A0A2I4AXG7_AUSLI|nr:PREDICTED: RNA-binding protein 12B-like [Austrofundulus limnaeus]XP_013860198.1 PREDICTED: RNA-binding protein 12B-like [Austrofundulus limnaeus]
MTTILRLEGLDEKAGIDDIRSFFKPLHIPDGGVYVVGGSLREAFIAFSTKREAQLAMRRSGEAIKGSKVTLNISSMARLERRLEALMKARTSRNMAIKPQPRTAAGLTSNVSPSAPFPPDPDAANVSHLKNQLPSANTSNENSLNPNVAFLLGVCTALQGLQSTQITEPVIDVFNTNKLRGEATPEQTVSSKPGYARLFGLPASTTKRDICRFFKGLSVQEAIVNVALGPCRGSLVKFTTQQDASDALRFNKQLLGSICVEVRGADEKMWLGALEECENASSVRATQKPEPRLKKNANSRDSLLKRKTAKQFPLKPSKRPKIDAPSTPQLEEYIVMVSKLPVTMTKTEIKQLFSCPGISHKNVLHLLDKTGMRTDTAFLVFHRVEDFDYAMNLSGCCVGSDVISVSSVTRKTMMEMLLKDRPKKLRSFPTDPRTYRGRGRDQTALEALPKKDPNRGGRTCLFVRNMPADVQKSQVKSLFEQFKVNMKDIVLLHDGDGGGTGEAVVQFQSEKLAAQAGLIHGTEFLGTNVLLTCITVKQMEGILAGV